MHDRQVLSFIRRLAPFESIWLILVKVMLINRVNGQQVIDLIKKPEMGSSYTFSWWAKGAIDQGRLETTLGFQFGDLDGTFLNMIPRDHLHYTGPQIWHCPSCIKIGYHSSVFCLRKIQSCPWHGDKLVSCSECYELLNCLHLPSRYKRSFPLEPKPSCEHMLALGKRLTSPDLSAPIYQEIGSWHHGFIRWLSDSERFVGGDIYRWVSSRVSRDCLDDVLLQYLDARIDIPKPFQADFGFPVARLSLEYSYEREGGVSTCRSSDRSSDRLYDMQCLGVVSISKIDQIRCIKSLRRYIWKKYISKHKKCYRSFIDLTLHQRMNLQPGSSCFASLAYVCWFMNALTTSNLAVVTGKGQCIYRAYGGRGHCPLATFKGILINRLVGFYSVWGALFRGAIGGETVVKFHNMVLEQTLGLNFSHIYKDIPEVPSPADTGEYGVYFVSADHLENLTASRCGCKSNVSHYVPPDLAVDKVERFYPDTSLVLKFIDPNSSKANKTYIYL